MTSLIKLENVFLRQPDKHEILKNINLDLHPGDFLQMEGPAGSGKSTLLKILALQIFPTSGKVFIEDKEIFDFKRRKIKNRMRETGYMSEDFYFLEEKSVFENMKYILKLKAHKKNDYFDNIMSVLKKSRLMAKREVSPSKLSFIEKKTLALSMVMVWKPKIIICDFNYGGFSDEKTALRMLADYASKNTVVVFSARPGIKADRKAVKVLRLENGEIT